MDCVEIGEVQDVLFTLVVEVLRDDLVDRAQVSICTISKVIANYCLKGLESRQDPFATVGHMSPCFALVHVEDLVPCLVFGQVAFLLKAAQQLVEDLVLRLLGLCEKGTEGECRGLPSSRNVEHAAKRSLARLHKLDVLVQGRLEGGHLLAVNEFLPLLGVLVMLNCALADDDGATCQVLSLLIGSEAEIINEPSLIFCDVFWWLVDRVLLQHRLINQVLKLTNPGDTARTKDGLLEILAETVLMLLLVNLQE